MIKSSKKCKIEGCEAKVFGKGYCKFHYPRKAIKKYSKKGLENKEKKKEYTEKQFELFRQIWNEREHNCQSCGKYLGKEIKSIFFDHLIEKSKRKDLALEKDNILLVCADCHHVKTIGFPTAKHLEYINKAKEKYLKNG